MKITVIGAGNMGSAFVKQLLLAGHKVSVTSRDSTKLAALIERNPDASAVNQSDAIRNTDLVILATGYADAIPALRALGNLADKVVVDITNPLTADYMGLTVGHSTSAAEEIAKHIPGAHVVKAFNTVFAQVLDSGADFGNQQKVSVFIAADNDQAKRTVTNLVDSLGFQSIDAGPLKNARYLEPLAGLNIYFGYGAGLGTSIAPNWIHKK
ncbi:MAG: NADPH-dependent F420 reductase [Moraxellaceae bacterium]|nr:MAG: NADPH-dependent F420 reductase [Moraxellaceae bacterium]